MTERFNRAVELFNRAKYFEAHELWEEEWRESADPERRCLQGLVQAAVALHHRSTGNLVGSTSVLERAIVNLRDCPDALRGIDTSQVRRELELALAALKTDDASANVTIRFAV